MNGTSSFILTQKTFLVAERFDRINEVKKFQESHSNNKYLHTICGSLPIDIQCGVNVCIHLNHCQCFAYILEDSYCKNGSGIKPHISSRSKQNGYHCRFGGLTITNICYILQKLSRIERSWQPKIHCTWARKQHCGQ